MKTANTARLGFTLIEMLVAVALTMVMMLLFTQIFSIATQSMSRQKGIAENDQRARMVSTMLRGDLQKRTFRVVMPFEFDETSSPSTAAYTREGYFEISENDPNDDTDDVLQFTVQCTIGKDSSPYYGKAVTLGNAAQFTDAQHINQPDRDDGNVSPDNTADSELAEISYFLRSGVLYRRVFLIRQPDPSVADAQPHVGGSADSAFNPLTTAPNNYPAANDFWNDFDFSAFRDPTANCAVFSSVDSLPNGSSGTSISLGFPWNRVGHDGPQSSPSNNTGWPREYATFAAPRGSGFIGRFTQEETSNAAFLYPNRPSTAPGNGDPMDIVGTSLSLTTIGPMQVVSAFANGPRKGVDVLLSNVHAFDVKVFDEGAGTFVDVGGVGATDFARGANQHVVQNVIYGPQCADQTTNSNNVGNNVFDTWNAGVQILTKVNAPAPYRPLKQDRTFALANQWSAQTYGATGVIAFSSTTDGFPFYYTITTLGTGVSTVAPSGTSTFSDPSGSGLVWTATPNWKPLRAIQITLRFLDVSSQQMRNLTIVESLKAAYP